MALNVRLSAEDEKIVKELKRHGVHLSDVVRKALKQELERVQSQTVDVDVLYAELDRLCPIAEDAPPPDYPNTTDRHALAAYVRQQLLERHQKTVADNTQPPVRRPRRAK